MKISYPFILFTALSTAQACDICGCYTPPIAAAHSDEANYASIAEQFTRFGSIRIDGHEVDDPAGQYLNSSITQIIVGRSFYDHRFAVQANIPLIYRDFKRPEGFTNEHGTESGLGDISLLGRYRVFESRSELAAQHWAIGGKNPAPVERANDDFSSSFHLLAGIKLPTGDSSRIKEEFSEIEVEGAPESGIHGHDLTLGTGSYDALFGGEVFARWKSFFIEMETRFTLRGDGRHSYHFANDLTWSAAPGWTFSSAPGRSFAIQAMVSGEYKDTDRFQGRVAGDTGITAVYVGPQVTANWGRFHAELGVDLPVVLDNTELQAVPDYRLRAALTMRF